MKTLPLQRALATVLRPFSKVKQEEALTVALMTLTAFLLLTAYYLLKTVREPLILLEGGAEVKLYARAAQAVLMVGVVHLYGELARRVGRAKLLATVFLFFTSNLALFALLATTSIHIGLAFFLWVGVFSYTVVAQFWALAADLYSEEQGKRLFPILGGGSSIGAVVGARLAKSLVPFGPHVLMGGGVVLLLVCVALILWVERRQAGAKVEKKAEEPLAKENALQLLAHDKYLLVIAGMVVLLNWVNSSGEYVLDRTLLAAATAAANETGVAPREFVGAFKADYFAWYNLIGVGLQLLVVSRVLAVAGVRRALFVLPLFAFGAYGAAMLFPVLAVVRLVKIGENSLQYSLQDTTRHALFLVTSRAEKFVGKTAIDTVAVRLGAIMSAIMVLIGSRLGWSTSVFAAVNVGLAVGWIGFCVAIGRENARRSDERAGASRGAPGPAEDSPAGVAGSAAG